MKEEGEVVIVVTTIAGIGAAAGCGIAAIIVQPSAFAGIP